MSLIFLSSDRAKSVTIKISVSVTAYLLVDVLKLELELSLLLVPLGHHLVEVGLDLDHLLVQPSQLLVGFLRLLVHL